MVHPPGRVTQLVLYHLRPLRLIAADFYTMIVFGLTLLLRLLLLRIALILASHAKSRTSPLRHVAMAFYLSTGDAPPSSTGLLSCYGSSGCPSSHPARARPFLSCIQLATGATL